MRRNAKYGKRTLQEEARNTFKDKGVGDKEHQAKQATGGESQQQGKSAQGRLLNEA